MLNNGIYSNKYNLIDRIINYYNFKGEFDNAKTLIQYLSSSISIKEGGIRKLYDKLKISITSKINEFYGMTILYSDIINNFLQRKLKVFIMYIYHIRKKILYNLKKRKKKFNWLR